MLLPIAGCLPSNMCVTSLTTSPQHHLVAKFPFRFCMVLPLISASYSYTPFVSLSSMLHTANHKKRFKPHQKDAKSPIPPATNMTTTRSPPGNLKAQKVLQTPLSFISGTLKAMGSQYGHVIHSIEISVTLFLALMAYTPRGP